jgi:NAD(P)-dependent dehydrogenase (short-subunit alcohol dehydrogenase family)
MSDIAVITGTTHGIGRVVARELARAGLTVVMLCRDATAAEELQAEIQRTAATAKVHVVRCDLASLASVREAAGSVRDQFGPLRLLINNAGMVSTKHRLSIDGFELTFATNHLGPFLLTSLLLDRMDPQIGRIVNTASRVHYKGRLDLEHVRDPRASYFGTTAYAQSKLANVLHTLALARRLAGAAITVNCLHPGVVATNLLPRWLQAIKPLFSWVMFDAERGARTTLHVALAGDLQGVTGRYFDEHRKEQQPSRLARDVELQDRLWMRSAEWVGVPAAVVAPH